MYLGKTPHKLLYLHYFSGEVTLSASDVSGTGWYGSVFTYKNVEDALNFKHASHYVGSSTISDAQYFKNDYVRSYSTSLLRCVRLISACFRF